jgi:hypothetical protein
MTANESSVERDEALLWLNDHIGELLVADLRVRYSNRSTSVCCAEGNLVYWASGDTQRLMGDTGALMAQVLAGVYEIGETTFDLTDYLLPWSFVIRRVPSELVLSFEAVELLFTVKERPI